MATSHISPAGNNLSCKICNGAFWNPAMIPCRHIFCFDCIKDCWSQDGANCICPECGVNFPYRFNLIQKITLAEVMSNTERRKRKAPSLGESSQAQKKHQSGTETSANLLCSHHKRPLDVYCITDNEILCDWCATAKHVGHKFGVVETERRRKQDELVKTQRKLKNTLQWEENELENMGKMLELIQVKARETEDHCQSVIVRVIDCLQKHFMTVKRQVGAQVKDAVTKVHNSQRTLKVEIEKLKTESAELQLLGQSETDTHFLQKWSQLQHLCEKDYSQPVFEDLEDLFIPFEETKNDVEKLGKQLEDICDKNVALVNFSESEEEEEPDQETNEDDLEQRHEPCPPLCYDVDDCRMEPKTREEFLQYACELSLDPTTAHEDLTISKGDTEVMLLPEKCKTPVIRWPQRFIRRRQVLCREGLQAERCYYEVEVKGNKMEIALTYKEIDRKSFSKHSAFGANLNSWSLDRSDSYSVSHNDNSIMLSAVPSHHKIGVYLEFKEGTLSFYEVSDNMKFLYKMQATFREPLYPGFWLSDKCRIRICNLKQQRRQTTS